MTPRQATALQTIVTNRYSTVTDVAQDLYGDDPTPAQMGATVRVLRSLVRAGHTMTTTDDYGHTVYTTHRSTR